MNLQGNIQNTDVLGGGEMVRSQLSRGWRPSIILDLRHKRSADKVEYKKTDLGADLLRTSF